MGLFGSLTKTVFDVATSPIEVVKDVVTLGGCTQGETETYLEKRLKKIDGDMDKISDDLGDL